MQNLKTILNVIMLTILGGATVIFSTLFVDTLHSGFFYEYSVFVKIAAIFFSTLFTVLSIIFCIMDKKVAYKSLLTTIILALIFIIMLYSLQKSGFLDKIDSTKDLQEYIAQYGSFAKIMFILIQFLQVSVVPIPGFITISAGVALFGPLMGGILSFIGIMLGSVVSFLIGKKLGYKAASWLVGKDELKIWMKKIKGKDKLVLTFMFLFPFFPDDVLCFVAGLSTMSFSFFIIMITITRIISIFTVTYSLNNSIIPYDTWWGLLIWAILIGLCIYLFFVFYKKGDKITKYLSDRKKFKRK